MVSPLAGEVSTESGSRLSAALLELAAGDEGGDATQLSELARHAAELLSAEAGGVLRFLGAERGVVVGVWRAGGTRGLPINAEIDFDRRNSALGRALSSGLPARADTYEGLRGELPVMMEAIGLRSSVAAPIVLGERAWGALVVATTRDKPLAQDAEQRLGELAALAAKALTAVEARRALEAARLRIVEDADEARRALEHELHEGPHQHLLALVLKLRVARAAAADGSEPARLIDEALEGALEAHAALRELARSIYPVVLTERGLAAAVQAIAVRAGVPVSLRRLPSRRFPPVVEATAYFAVAEALACVAEHADATEAVVQVADAPGELIAEVRDDGSGAGDPAECLRAVAERVRAVGGTLVVDSTPGGGTVVRAVLPLAA